MEITMIKILKAKYINLRNELAYRSQVKKTMNELQKLSDHDLWDIGLSRGEIWEVAHDSHAKPAKVEVEDIEVNANIKGWV